MEQAIGRGGGPQGAAAVELSERTQERRDLTKKTKLELTWPGKDERPKLEPRILIEDPAMSHHAAVRREGDLFDNMLIRGDNLLALKALEADYAGKVKCIYIDPPFNTGSAFDHYEDGLEHSLWLRLMRGRLELLRGLLRQDGVILVHLDDNESHYCKVLMDEVFGRQNYVNEIILSKTSHLDLRARPTESSNKPSTSFFTLGRRLISASTKTHC